MQNRMIVACAVALLAAVGCGGGGHTSSDAGPGDGGGRSARATITVSGASVASWSYVDSHSLSGNYVSCVADGTGFFGLSADDFAGGSNGISLGLHGYHGAGTYPISYDGPDYRNLTLRVDIGSYNYSFGYTSGAPYATCTITFDAATTAAHATGTIDCTTLSAGITSPDYVSGGRQPTIGLHIDLDCDL
jgi:hypothetical protein